MKIEIRRFPGKLGKTVFVEDENAAVSVDFVVLVAAIAGIGIAAVATTWNGVEAQSDKFNDCMAIHKKLHNKDNLDYQTRLKRIQRQCARL
ncbi:MAG: hypothetical protein KDK00_07800 [Rhodobacteraceae bacterium]|nr:hypothetical protein [Paracoccaceae bacterium]